MSVSIVPIDLLKSINEQEVKSNDCDCLDRAVSNVACSILTNEKYDSIDKLINSKEIEEIGNLSFHEYECQNLNLEIFHSIKERKNDGAKSNFFKETYTRYNPYKHRILNGNVPDSSDWPKRMKSIEKPMNPGCFMLAGREAPYTQDEFAKNPLFKDALEKYVIFSNLCERTKKESFKLEQAEFLQEIQEDGWAGILNEMNFEDLAYHALYAHLSGKITEQEFVISQMAAASLEWKSSGGPQPKFFVLTKETFHDYLLQHGYDVSEEEASKAWDQYEREISSPCSSLARTSIEYEPIQWDEDCLEALIFQGLSFLRANHESNERILQLGQPTYEERENTETTFPMVVLPPKLTLALFKQLTTLAKDPPSDHHWMLGYSTNLSYLASGRPISIPSPLAACPFVHDTKNVGALGVFCHDMYYHVAVDWMNPYTEELIKMGQACRERMKELKRKGLEGEKEFKVYQGAAIELLDRERPPEKNQRKDIQEVILDIFKKNILDPESISSEFEADLKDFINSVVNGFIS